MVFRAFRAAAAALAFLLAAAPAYAQHFSESYQFLEAVRKGDGTKVMQLVTDSNGSIVNTKSRETGDAALHIVAKNGDPVFLRYLIQKGANPNVQDAAGNSPMMVAVNSGFDEGVGILITYHANVNLPNNSGETPLIRAVQLRKRDLVVTLLAAGGDPDKADVIAGMSARDYARTDNRSPAIAKLLADAPKAAKSNMAGPRL
ncbi:MAG: ankyrin repeat domain-containing protein [Pseudomonadota bacterium]